MPPPLSRRRAPRAACLLGQLLGAAAVGTLLLARGSAAQAAENATVTCISYTARPDEALVSAGGDVVVSPILVGEEVGPPVGPVEVRGLALEHARTGALRVSLLWLPANDSSPPASPRELEEAAQAVSILKDARQGGSAANITSLAFSDGANATLGAQASNGVEGTFRPATPLDAFARRKLPSRALWVLVVEDVGSGRASRSITLLDWSLVLCPPYNATLPPSLIDQMAQQAGGLPAAASRGGAFAARGRGGLQPALPTLLTVSASTTYLTYTELADAAVDAFVGAIDNVQELLQLPRTPEPLIDRVLPWVELLIGGTDLTVQNQVWPGRIVVYALQLEVFVRTREAMAANATGTGTGGTPAGGGANSATGTSVGTSGSAAGTGATGGGGTSGGGGSGGSGGGGSGGDETPNCGVIGGANGNLVVVNKKLLKRDLCPLLMPADAAQYAQDGAMEQSGSGGGDGANMDGGGDATMRAASDTPLQPFGQQREDPVGRWVTPSLQLATPLTPMSFVRAPLFPAAGPGVRLPVEAQQALQAAGGAGAQLGLGVPQLGKPFPDPQAATRILNDAFAALDMQTFHDAVMTQLDASIVNSDRALLLLQAAENSPQLMRAAGPEAVKTAQALSAGTETYQEVLKAGKESIKRLSMDDLMNKTKEFLKNGGLQKEFDGMNKASSSSGLSNRFIFNFQRIRLQFRFSAADGPTFTFTQWVYLLSDVNAIINLSRQLETLDAASNGKYSNAKSKWDKQDKGEKGNKDGNGKPFFRSSEQPRKGVLPNGQAPAAWFKDVVDEARGLAKRVLSSVPVDEGMRLFPKSAGL